MIKNNISILCSGLVALALVGCSQMPVNQAAPLTNTLHAGIIQEPIIAYFSEDAGLAEIHFGVDDEEFNPKGQIWDQQGQAITDQTQRIQTLYDLEKQVNSEK